MAGAVISAFAIFTSLQIFIHYPFATKSFETAPLRSPFFAMQDGVHGRCGDLRLCHFHLFTKSFESVPLRPLFYTAGWCAWQARLPPPLPSSSLYKFFWICPFKIPFSAMQDNVHGRYCDLHLRHLHLFTNLLTLSLCDKTFETVPLKSHFLSCRLVCMAGAVTSAFAIFISLRFFIHYPFATKLLKLSL